MASTGEDAAVAKEGEGSTVLRRALRPRVVHPDVADFLWGSRRWREHKPASAAATPPPVVVEEEDEEVGGERARYDCAFEDERWVEAKEGSTRGGGGLPLPPPRLVWGKVKSHPWWPGQVFDAADASELALEQRRRRGAALVAFFWDKTFAWADDTRLRPLRGGFDRLAGQSSLSTFTASVDAALGEVARRVGSGLSCDCCTDAVARKRQVVVNAGIREGAHGAVADAAFARDALCGEAFVGYVSALAVAPLAGADRLDLTIATAQLEALNRWRRPARALAEYTAHYGVDDVGANAKKAKSVRAKRKRPSRANGATPSRRKNVDDAAAAMELENFEPSPQPLSHQMSTKMGKLMHRAAQQMSQSPARPRAHVAAPSPSPMLPRANGAAPDPANPLRMMARCATGASPLRSNGGDLKDDNENGTVMAGLVLNFIAPSAVPPANELAKIYSQFGPISEASTENAFAVVVFKRRPDAEVAFSGTAKIGALSSSLVSFRLTYSLPAASPIDPPRSTWSSGNDHLPMPLEALVANPF